MGEGRDKEERKTRSFLSFNCLIGVDRYDLQNERYFDNLISRYLCLLSALSAGEGDKEGFLPFL